MTSKERMLIAMRGGQADSVPVAPDMSNMIPCRLTGKPFWDIYLYQDPPLWKAYIDAVKYFGFDGWLPSLPVGVPAETPTDAPVWKQAIVHRTEDRIYTRSHAVIDGKEQWSDRCTVYYIADSPTLNVPLQKLGLPEGAPSEWEDVVYRSHYPNPYEEARTLMGDMGVVGPGVGLPGMGGSPEAVYEYYDHPDRVRERCQRQHEGIVQHTRKILTVKPDFILIGVSGFMIYNPEKIFRELALSTLKDVTKLCKEAGVVSQIHCCGPEYDLVKISALESDLDSINPLEAPPMGDCDLAQLKREFGDKISLMGNLHTTDVMLRGTVEDVKEACKKAIDDAGAGGGFILSTGDQCGRDTPDENIFAMIEVARDYGRYG